MSLIRRRGAMGQAGAGGGDPHWANVVSLLHFDGANASTAFPDQRGKVWSRNTPLVISTAQSKFGGASALFGGGHLNCVGGTDFAFGTGDFTIECWLRGTQFGTTPGGTILDNRVTGGPSMVIYQQNSTSRLDVLLDGAIRISTPTLSNSVWMHLALCRASGTTRFFVGGVSAGTYADSNNYGDDDLTNVRLGASFVGGSGLLGNMDDFRMTKGVARYTDDFTPPTAAFPNY